ncbi:Salutaridinol 7-O-acetyltransferase [Acorus calamus]|uniref:Salutaridinol 7-O-acetyltransferase n=1 Tax=Acorus calamus TaxID=4465 RepID=A0AAV9C5R3_ACOCL|nr:Salutaridinol 7-O-acetyltransferase [Acorus calamus]
MLKVEVLSKKTIKPSTPTPPHLRTFNLSLLDQLFPAYWVHVILFYHGGDRSLDPAGRLKRSLSETLTHHYPIAGRIKESSPGGKIYIECNDEGVEFSESVVDCDVDSVLSNPPIEEFVHLIPVKHTYFSIDEPLLAVQLNRFKCGGWALGVCVSHRVADGISMSSLITSWAKAATGGGGEGGVPGHFFELGSIMPTQDGLPPIHSTPTPTPVVPGRFVISGSSIERLRRDNSTYNRSSRPTRFEAATCLLWRCAMRAAGDSARARRPHAMVSVDVRRRMPLAALGECKVGNAFVMASAVGERVAADGGRERQGFLEERLRGAVKGVNGEYVRAYMPKKEEAAAAGAVVDERLMFSHWCRFPLYEADFGWGRPAWLGQASYEFCNFVLFMEGRGADGMEAWVWLQEEELKRLRNDPELLSFTS